MSWRLLLTRFGVILVPLTFLTLTAAAPISHDSPEELIRSANAEFAAGKQDAADQLYAAAEERTADPGMVAFNRAAVLFARGQFREAERFYDRVLDDAACPPERAARAWFNRGTCLIHRGGTASIYRSAIACFERTLDSEAADEPLKADARHNLELAKLLWLEEVKKETKAEPHSPNTEVPPEENRNSRPEPPKPPEGKEPGSGDSNDGKSPKLGPQPVALPNGGIIPKSGEQKVAGNNALLDVLQDSDEVQSLSPEDARKYLKEVSERRKRELRSMLRSLYGPERVDVRDW